MILRIITFIPMLLVLYFVAMYWDKIKEPIDIISSAIGGF
jgi:hypothetical protein